jgi:ATP/maltotriose-dependent transcriptional regulator MalT
MTAVADYLSREAFMQWPDESQQLLRRASVFDRFSASLC